MGTLFVVATPIGNLEDITLRALRVLREAALIAAEDTRTTRILLGKHGITTRLISYNEHNMAMRTPQILQALESGDVGLVSEAGTPGVSDPGHQLIVAALQAGLPVVSIPGPSAVIAALATSGLPMREFTFLGFLPRRSGERRRALSKLAGEPRTLVFFESPHRLRQTLEDISTTLGDRHMAVCRELTKAFEEVFRGSVSEALSHFADPRGEFTVVVEGALETAARADEATIIRELKRRLGDGSSARDAASQVSADLSVPRRRVYELSLRLRSATPPSRKVRPPGGS
jgi:16S rRNA (cytidine1402-2'-O)-methyltransferase